MSTIANLTVKKNDNTTDVVYTAQTGASGDTPALWFAPALGATGATRPELRMNSKTIGGSPNKRRVVGTFMFPYSVVNSTTGVTSVEKRLMGRIEMSPDFDVPTSVIDEFVSQFANLIVAAKVQFKEGAAAV